MVPAPISEAGSTAERPAAASAAGSVPWSHRRFFDALGALGRLRVVSRSGPSTFEALCRFGPYGFGHGHMNALTDAYHWHLALDGFGHVRSCDTVHERSGRRVLFFELRERAEAAPFLFIYLHREKGEEFDAQRERQFAAIHAELSGGRALEPQAVSR